MDVLERVEDREARLDAEEDRGVALGHVQVHEHGRFARGAVERRREIDRDGRAAHAALATQHGERPSGHRAERGTRHAADGGFEVVELDRFRHPLADAHPHRVQHFLGVECLGQDHDTGLREVALQAHDLAGHGRQAPGVDDEHVGPLGAGDVPGDDHVEVAVIDGEAAVAQRRSQVACDGAEQGDSGLHEDYLTSATLMTNDDCGSAVMELLGAAG